MNEYDQRANDFAKKYGLKLSVLDVRYGEMWGDKQKRYIFKMRLSRKRKSYTFEFGQSIMNGNQEPRMYDVLACVQKYDIGTFEDFCRSYGYDEDSRSVERTYKACCKEYAAMERLFADCDKEVWDELWEIN